MDRETSSTEHVRAEDALEDQKYHPLILQQTYNTQLLTTIDRIDFQEKQNFLQKLHDAFKDILKCSKCDSILKENSVGFACGHTFCQKCAVMPNSCLNCQNDGYNNGSKIGNLSGVLGDITNLKTNFNQESVLFELIKFLVTPASMIVKRESVRAEVGEGTPVLPPIGSTSTKSRGKFTSTGKRFKTMFDKTDNRKRKLLFNKNPADSPTQTQLLENDSESLFIDSSNKTRSCKPEKVTSYLAVQSSIDESPKFDTTNLKTYSRSAKRKLDCVDSAGNTTEKLVDNRNTAIESSTKKRKLKAGVADPGTDKTPGTAGNSAKRKRSSRNRWMSNISDGSSSAKKTGRVVESCKPKSNTPVSGTPTRRTSRRANSKISLDESLDLKPEGRFSGFQQTHVTDSYNKLRTMSKYYNRKVRDDKVTLKMNIEEDGNNMCSNVLDQEKLPCNVQDPPRISRRTEASGECANVIDYDKKKIQFNIRRQSRKVTEEDGDLQTNSEAKELEKFPNVEEPKAAEVENNDTGQIRLSCEPGELKGVTEVLNTSYHQNPSHVDTKANVKVNIAKYGAETEKENFGETFTDVDADDVVDVNLWDRVDKGNRKKKSLFKSVKERNKKNVLLKLLEEKALRRENEKKDDPNMSEACVSFVAPTVNSSVVLEVEPPNDKNSPESARAVDSVSSRDALKVVNERTSDPGSSPTYVSSYTYTPLLPEENIELATSASENTSITLAPFEDCRRSAESPDVSKVSIPRIEDTIDIPVPVEEHPQTSRIRTQDLRQSTELTVSLTRLPSGCYTTNPECNSELSSGQKQYESTPTPIAKRAKFMYNANRVNDSPQSAGACSPVMAPESAVICVDMRNGAVPNTSTPIVDKYSQMCKDDCKSIDSKLGIRRSVKKLPTHLPDSNGEESSANESSSSIVIRTQRSSTQLPVIASLRTREPTEEVDVDDYVPPETVTETNVKLKCANLKRAINKQNQKMLTSLHRDFGVMSPPVLSIAKGKHDKHRSPVRLDSESPTFKSHSEDKWKGDVSEESSANLRQSDNPLNKVQNLPSSELDDVLTIPGSPARKSVSCQTTPELHVALLMREFPHLFQRTDLPLSVYDTPVESTLASGVTTKTPDLRTSLLGQHDRFTRVSSVTSSEKKLVEREFAEHSVLCDSFRTPAGGIGVADERVDLSCIALLPSSTKKVPECESQDSEKRKLSVRLNFQDVEPSAAEESELPAASIEDIISIHDTTYCSGLKSRSLNSTQQEADNEKQNGLSNASNEIEFADVSAAQPAKNVDATTRDYAGNAGADLSVSMVIDTNVSVIPDTNAPGGEDFEIFADDESKEKSVENADETTDRKSVGAVDVNVLRIPGSVEENGYKSPEADVDVDDEDVDFVAGTPTCYSKRCPDSSFEMLRSQSMITRPGDSDQLSLANKSNPLFDSLDCRTLKTQSSLAVDASKVSVPSHASTAKSVDLFNSDSMVSTATPVHVTTSGLKEADNRIVKLFCDRFSAVLLDRLTDKTTHLVVKTDANNETARTFKYLQAIVNCVRVVSINWLDECLRRGCVVDEESFIPLDSSGECGPLRAFNVSRNVTPSPLSWLQDYCVFFVEPVPQGCTVSQLQEIIVRAGAVVVNSLKEMKKYPSHHRVIIVSEDDDNVEISNEEIANWLEVYQAVAIEFNWLLEVIGRNRLVPFVEYEVVEIPEELLLKLNFPSDMLQVED